MSYDTGAFRYNGGTSFTKLTSAVPNSVGVDIDGAGVTFVGSFSTGTWLHKGGWTKITTAVAHDIG
jgi:hypothetical protein